MPKVSTNGCELYYETGGDGAPVVYVHGGFAGLDTLLHNLQPYDWTWEHAFAEQFHFIAYDRRGCYRSASPETGYDIANQAHDLAGLLDQSRSHSTNYGIKLRRSRAAHWMSIWSASGHGAAAPEGSARTSLRD